MVAVWLGFDRQCCGDLESLAGDRVNYLITFLTPRGDRVSKVVGAGEIASVHFPSPFLISAGQDVEFGIAVRRIITEEDYIGHSIKGKVDAVLVPVSYDYSIMPTSRHLSTILADVVRHGVDNPTHGTDCACLDRYVWEVRAHISKAVPPDRGATDDVHLRLDGRFRIAHVLKLAARDL